MHRLNRAEYANAIHDLLALDVDATALLPPDDESSGFDNIADVLRMSPSLMERYLSASWNISRLAVGNLNIAPATATYRVRPDLSQDQHIEGLPLGTRGGILVKHYVPARRRIRDQAAPVAQYVRPDARHGRCPSDRDQRGRKAGAAGDRRRPRRIPQDGGESGSIRRRPGQAADGSRAGEGRPARHRCVDRSAGVTPRRTTWSSRFCGPRSMDSTSWAIRPWTASPSKVR